MHKKTEAERVRYSASVLSNSFLISELALNDNPMLKSTPWAIEGISVICRTNTGFNALMGYLHCRCTAGCCHNSHYSHKPKKGRVMADESQTASCCWLPFCATSAPGAAALFHPSGLRSRVLAPRITQYYMTFPTPLLAHLLTTQSSSHLLRLALRQSSLFSVGSVPHSCPGTVCDLQRHTGRN